jgi:hypothetical protein
VNVCFCFNRGRGGGGLRPAGLDYWIWLVQPCGLGSSLSDLFGRLLGCLMVLVRREVSKDAELLLLRHENGVLRRQIGRVRYQPGDRLWLAALSRLIPGTAGPRCSW